METVPPTARLVKFGVFEIDLRAEELRKGGLKLKLTGQPFQVLALLLERPGDVVTREEIQKRLWPEGTFVDFDHNLNAAINKIREVLGDSAENPRFVETLPRRGYRFIYPVGEPSRLPPAGVAVAPVSPPAIAAMGASLRGSPVGTPALQRARAASPHLRRSLAFGLAAFIVVLAIAYMFRPTLPPPQVLSSMQITSDGQTKGGIVTDGTRLYFGTFVGGGYRLYQVSTAGGPAAPYTTPVEGPLLLDISPDRGQLLVESLVGTVRDLPLYAVPVLGGSPHRLDSLLANDATWSPDGRQLLYSKVNGLYIAGADGTESRKIATLDGVAFHPRWSPDGNQIRFSVQTERRGPSIWEMAADGNGLHPFLAGWNDAPSECCGAWTLDGKYYFFQSHKGGTRNIWAMREGGSLVYKVNHQPVQVTTGPAATFSPLPSLDGKKLFAITSQVRGKLVRYDARSSEFVPYLNGSSITCVDFSKDGVWMAYVQYPVQTLWRSKVDGSDRVQLTFSPMEAAEPRWSPDGARIAFIGGMGPVPHVYLIAADGTGAPQLIPDAPGEAGGMGPDWSPDGNSLLFSGAPPIMSGKSSPSAVHIMDMRTRKVTTLPGSEGLWVARWSPNGRYIAAKTNDSRRLMVYDVSASKWHDADVNSTLSYLEWITYLSWSRDSQALYFGGNPKGRPAAIFRLWLGDHRLEQVASLAHFRQATQGSGDWIGIAPDDSPLLVEDVGTEDIYALDLKLP